MSGILKVDQIQLRDGSTPSAADLGITGTGKLLGMSNPTELVGSSSYSEQSVQLTGTVYYLPSGKITNTYTKKSDTSNLIVHYGYKFRYDSGWGAHMMLIWKDSLNFKVLGYDPYTYPTFHTGTAVFSGLNAGEHTFNVSAGRDSTGSAVGYSLNTGDNSAYQTSYLYIMEVEQ
jgi:hypothetical protein